MTVGDLSATHFGAEITLTPPGEEHALSGALVRVQHNAPTIDSAGSVVPAVTLVATEAWAGQLDPTHPVEVGSDG